jgi:hypothetical protein
MLSAGALQTLGHNQKMATRLIDPFEGILCTLVDDDVAIADEVLTTALSIVRQLPLGVRLPHPIPLGCGLVLEWSAGPDLADIEIRDDLSLVTTLDARGRITTDKFDSIEHPEFGSFLQAVVRHFRH